MYSYEAKADIEAYRFVKFDTNGVKQASSANDKIIGISDSVDFSTSDCIDIYVPGERAEVMAGGTFSAGDALTSDANGKAVVATAASNIGAIALENAVSGDVVSVLVSVQRVIGE